MKTLSIGLTGSIGSGKTFISKVFSQMGIPVFNADKEAKKLYMIPQVQADLERMFSQKLFHKNILDKDKLSQIIFNDKNKLIQLNNYIHPLVKQEYEKFVCYNTTLHFPYVVTESAIIFESKWQNLFDKIICIDTPIELIIERTIKRDNSTKETVLKKLANQLPIKDKISLSDYRIINDNLALVLPQIIEIDKNIKKQSNR